MPTTEPSGLSDQPDRLGWAEVTHKQLVIADSQSSEYRLKVWQQPVLARLCSYKEENETSESIGWRCLRSR